jgi:hypothetical protein
MRHRSHLFARERAARSRLAKLLHSSPLLRGSLVRMARACGKPGCKCLQGEKHVSLYLAIRQGRRRALVYVPRPWEPMIRACVKTWKEADGLIDEVSRAQLERFLKAKRVPAGKPPARRPLQRRSR